MSLLHSPADGVGHAHAVGHGLLARSGADAASLRDDRRSHGVVGGLDPRGRVAAAVVFAIAVVSFERLSTLLLALAAAGVVALAARLDLSATARRLLALEGFMVAALATLPFTVPGAPVLTVFGLGASAEGFAQAAAILLKANAVVLMLSALVGSMDPVVLGRTLARLGAPEKLVQLYLFTVRYLDVLHEEHRRLRTAMRARGFVMRTDRHTWVSLGQLFGMLMVRSLERSERILAAMRCRGFDGRFPSLEEPAAFRRCDGAWALASVAGLALLLTVETLVA